MASYFLGLDIGTSATKALLMDASGAPIATVSGGYPLSTPRPQWAEQDPDQWWDAACSVTRSVIEQSGVRPEEIAAVGLSGQMHGSVFLDKSGSVIRPAILWCDQRTQTQCDWIVEQAGAGNLAKYIGNPVLTGFTAPKIVWLRDNEPDAYARVDKVVLPKDYVRYRLTGDYATDVSDASGTALFDISGRRWSTEMLGASDIPARWMPEAFESPTITGVVTAGAAVETGLAAGTRVVAGAGDQAAGAVGAGIVEAGIVSSVVGTSGVVFAFSDNPAIDPALRVHTFCHAVPGKWHTMGVSLSAGGSLRWLRDTFYAGETYAAITDEAAGVSAGSEGLLFLPYLTGERTPHPDPDARGVFFGITLRQTRAHFARAVLEGVAFALKDTFEIFKDLGVPISEVRASGGGARSALWRQIHADVTGFPHIAMGVDEGPAHGAVLLAAVGAGIYPSVADACRSAVRLAEVAQPNRETGDVYRRTYSVYRDLYPALKPHFGRL